MKKFLLCEKIFYLNVLLFSFFSCSLNYKNENENVEKKIPELVFDDVQFSRYEKDEKKIFLKANSLEQFKGAKELYARNVFFEMYKNEKTNASGKCDLLALDLENKNYFLYDNIFLQKDSFSLKGDALSFNGKTEQITSARNDTLTLTSNGTTIIGSGFSASTVDNSFAFSGAVSGTIDTDYKKEETKE